MEMPDVIYARFIPERRNNSGTWSVFEKPHCKWGPTTRTVKVDHERQKYHHSRVVEALQKESEENCRLLGMSAERELALLAEIDRLKAKLAKTEWQPIETAPMDGTRVLVTDGFMVGDAYFRRGDWWLYECGDDWYSVTINPTNWMPLPQPPTTEETK